MNTLMPFEPGDLGLKKFYDRVTPGLAEGLGANLRKNAWEYTLTFPDAKIYGGK